METRIRDAAHDAAQVKELPPRRHSLGGADHGPAELGGVDARLAAVGHAHAGDRLAVTIEDGCRHGCVALQHLSILMRIASLTLSIEDAPQSRQGVRTLSGAAYEGIRR